MEYVYSRHGAGLIVAENAMDERTVQTDLQAFDPRLRLVSQFDQDCGWYYEVVCVWSPEHDARSVYKHRENGGIGEPLPLSSRVLDEVRRLQGDALFDAAETANARLVAAKKQQARDDAAALAQEHAPYVDRNRVQVTTAKVGRKPYWMRNKHLKAA